MIISRDTERLVGKRMVDLGYPIDDASLTALGLLSEHGGLHIYWSEHGRTKWFRYTPDLHLDSIGQPQP